MNVILSGILTENSDWEVSDYVHRSSGDNFPFMMQEIDCLLEKKFPLGLALMMGDMDLSFLREIKRIVKDQADYIALVVSGPFVVAVFHQRLFIELKSRLQVLAEDADVSCGVVLSQGFKNHGEILLGARIALHRAIARGIGILVLDPEEAIRAVGDHAIGVAMKKQLAEGGRDFEAYFQPQIDIRTAHPKGAEALARWHPDNEEIPPSRFIPIAEEAGLIGDIGRMMFTLSARAIKVLRNSGIWIPHIAVNVSPLQSRQEDLLRSILEILRSENLSPADIEIEITESLAGNGGGEFLRWLAELSAAGFQIAIDDFGTGTSTLARIREIPAAKIKLDRAFVSALPDDAAACVVCRASLDLVHALGKTSLAEGVERVDQASYLNSLDCALGQGFLWAQPMAVNDLMAWWNGDRTCKGRQSFSATDAHLMRATT